MKRQKSEGKLTRFFSRKKSQKLNKLDEVNSNGCEPETSPPLSSTPEPRGMSHGDITTNQIVYLNAQVNQLLAQLAELKEENEKLKEKSIAQVSENDILFQGLAETVGLLMANSTKQVTVSDYTAMHKAVELLKLKRGYVTPRQNLGTEYGNRIRLSTRLVPVLREGEPPIPSNGMVRSKSVMMPETLKPETLNNSEDSVDKE